MDTLIKNNDLITHKVHRHEPPVVGERINIIHKDDNLVVINKPPSIPVCCVCVYMSSEHTIPPWYHMVGNFRGVQIFVDFVCSAYPHKKITEFYKSRYATKI